MKRITLVAATLALAACSDNALVDTTGPEVAHPRAYLGPVETIFTNQTPESTLDASPGWEVATRFTPEADGRITGFRFWKADGETGTHTARLWNSAGTQIASGTFSSETTSGWQSVSITGVYVYAGSTYRVSVNTNTKQVKTYNYFGINGPISNGNLYADYSYYGQPTGSRPTTGSGSIYFVDVNFREVIPISPSPCYIDQPCP